MLSNNNIEVWKDVIGFQGTYQISNFGRVRSIDRLVNGRDNSKRRVKGVMLKPAKSKSHGYWVVNFYLNDSYLVHRLVAIHFIENALHKKCVNHMDGNKDNNHVSNLEWVTYSENTIHSFRVLGQKSNKFNSLEHPNSKRVARFKRNKIIEIFSSASLASRVLGRSYTFMHKRLNNNVFVNDDYTYKYISNNRFNMLSKRSDIKIHLK